MIPTMIPTPTFQQGQCDGLNGSTPPASGLPDGVADRPGQKDLFVALLCHAAEAKPPPNHRRDATSSHRLRTLALALCGQASWYARTSRDPRRSRTPRASGPAARCTPSRGALTNPSRNASVRTTRFAARPSGTSTVSVSLCEKRPWEAVREGARVSCIHLSKRCVVNLPTIGTFILFFSCFIGESCFNV